MKNLKIFIIILIILIIILSITLIFVLKSNDLTDQTNIATDFEEGAEFELEGVEPVADRVLWETVSGCLNNYLNIINVNNLMYEEEYSLNEVVYELLSKEYIKQNSITSKNILNYIDKVESDQVFIPINMNYIRKDSITAFSVYGIIEDKISYEFIKDAYYIVNLDTSTEVIKYSIEPLSENYNSIDDIKLVNNGEKIEENEQNTMNFSRMNNELAARRYLYYYKRLALSAPQFIYERLNQEYKTRRWNTVEQFKNYIEENRQQILTSNLEQYSVQNDGEYKYYVCTDQNENTYIFKENELQDYEIFLDMYTIDVPQIVEEYNNLPLENKCAYNIQKIRQALNNADYKYLYSKLADSFKSNYFKNETDFENYVKNNFYKKNAIEYTNVDNQNDSYIFTVSITNIDDSSAKPIEKTIVVQLKEGTDFVFSFSV